MKNIRIGDVLVGDGLITNEQLMAALKIQKQNPSKRIGAILVENHYVSEEQLLGALGKHLDLRVVDLNRIDISMEAAAKIPKAIALQYTLVPIAITNNGRTLRIASNDPLDFYAIEDVKLITSMDVETVLATKAVLNRTIDFVYSDVAAKKAATDANALSSDETISIVEDLDAEGNDDTPIVNLVNSILVKGYTSGASDIHIEPFEDHTNVRIRVDGLLIDYIQLSTSLHQSFIARIKILSNLDIAERRLPQDGHFRAKVKGIEVNIRTSLIPTAFGEKAVLRFLSMNTKLDHAASFGMIQEDYLKMLDILRVPNGIIYMTGPTGSGKTTTLYMILEMLSQRSVNIATIEDPVEQNLPRVNQTQVNPTAGLTFEVGLRSLLRQDPDIIMLGETRDSETANIAIRAAITGHLVLSTLHTNDAVSTVLRLIDMGVEPYMVASSLSGVVAQRLVKKLCPHCKEAYEPSVKEKALLGDIPVSKIYRAKGCKYCNQTGYRGRVAVHEILAIDQKISALIAKSAPAEEIYAYVKQEHKIKFLRNSLMQLVANGDTSIDELVKVTYYIE